MALNWDEFLNNESLDIPNDPWSDPTTVSPGLLNFEMPKSTNTDTSRSVPEDVVNFDSFLNGSSFDPLFDDSIFMPNDYFLSDLEVLKPFGDAGGGATTSESSPEPEPANSLSRHSSAALLAELSQLPQMTAIQTQMIQRANILCDTTYGSISPNNQEGGFVEDLTFPDRLDGIRGSNTPVFDPIQTSTGTTTKRNKGTSDSLSACWTSPMCPSHSQGGVPPNPSTCGGGCAPFFFADHDSLPVINDLLTDPQEETSADGVVEIQLRPKKRSESETSMEEPSGRHFTSQNTIASAAENRQRMTSETSDDSPGKHSPQATIEDRPKSQRRQPHNQVERKYRESLNTQLESLRRVVPSLQQNHGLCDGADIEDLPTPSKPSKAVILASATAHIRQQEKERKSLADENQALKARIKALQALVKCDDCSLMHYVMDLKINQAKQ
jgi:hypothetical protein